MSLEPLTRLMPANAEAIAEAARILSAGGLVAFPTETVYGLGADATNAIAIAKLYAAKGRPRFNPLIAHVADSAAARSLAQFNPAADKLAANFWPGPLTLVLAKAATGLVAELATAGLDSIAVRVPQHAVARDLLHVFGRPLVAPSANRSGHVSPTSAAHVMSDLRGRIDLILDGGPAPVGLESSIVACLDRPTLLRPGGLARAEIERALGAPLDDAQGAPAEDDAPLAPGMLASHYAPRTQLRLDATELRRGEVLLAFGPTLPSGAMNSVRTLNLSPAGNLVEAAAHLFSHLRALDAANATAIAVMPVPQEGLGEAINDRLARAAAPRESPSHE